MSVEPILSDELLAELGNDPNAVLIGKKRKQEVSEEEKKRKYIPEDELKKFKKLSKKEQKRFEQREKKKERASKQGEYMEIIKANEISDQQRDMLLSSRQLNHTATLREQLTMLIKKEKAGIKLSEEELDLLYPNRHQQDEDNDSSDDDTSLANGNIVTSKVATHVPETSANETKEGTSETLFSFSSLFSPQATKNLASTNGHDSDSSVDEKKKDKRKKKKKVQRADETNQTEKPEIESQSQPHNTSGEIISKATEITETNNNTVPSSIPQPSAEKKPFSAAGLGKNLLAQFSKIKEQKASAETKSDEKDTKVSTIFSSEFDYNPDSPKLFTSSVPEVPDAIKEIMALEEAKAASIAPKPVLRDIYFNDRRHIPVERPHQVAIDRMNLPVCQMEQEIVEAVNNHDVIILCGETGSGKSTQVPQFLYEAGYAQDEDHLIGVAQPRRVAVTSTAERVNFEMGCTLPEIAHQKKLNKHKKNMRKRKEKEAKRKAARIAEGTDNANEVDNEEEEEEEEDEVQEDEDKRLAKYYPNGRKVGYQIRYDSTTVGSDTRIKFMTDGILLREISQDLLLRKYSVIILDEAHERNVNTDILLGMISRAIPLRKEIAAKEYKKWQRLSEENRATFALPLAPLKLIIMSATLRVDDFRQERLFNPLPPIIKVEARQYPVTNHFAKRTETKDYLQEAFKKTCQIHERLPPGGVLMFLTGKREILFMCKRLQRALGPKKSAKHRSSQHNASGKNNKEEDETPFEAMLADLQPTSTQGNKKNEAIGDNNDNNEDMNVGFDGDEIDEIDAGSEQGEDDYDAMNWNDQKNRDDDSENLHFNDDDSVISDIDDEDYVPPVQKTNHIKPKKENDEDDDEGEEGDADREAARLRREMLANILGTNKKADNDVSANDSDNDDNDKKVSSTDENNNNNKNNEEEEDVNNFDPDSSRLPRSEDNDNLPKLKPWILPLYAMMPAHLQKKVFAPVPAGYRLIVIATNVAETSITIPGIRYVVDCGRGKEKVLASGSVNGQEESSTSSSSSSSHVYEAGITRYEVKWISKASSDQRAGRAGRTGPGHCYRLYSSNFYHEHMQAFMPPEINVTPLEDIVLHMLSLGISEIESFPFPSNPPRAAVHAAVTLLRNLGAIQRDTVATRAKEREARLWSLLNQTKADLNTHKDEPKLSLGQLSPLGKMLRWFPIHPRFAKMLVVATQTTVNRLRNDDNEEDDEDKDETDEDKWRLLSHVLTMVATLTERSVFVFDDMDNDKDDDNDDDDDDEDDDSDKDSDSDNDNSDNDQNTGRKRKTPSVATARHTSKKSKTTRHSKQSKWLAGRKLFFHTSGDVMARVRATGAYLFTLYTTLARHRQARHAAKEAEKEAERQRQQELGTNPPSTADNTTTKKSETLPGDTHETASTSSSSFSYHKWEYDLANQDPAVVSLCQTFHLHLGTLSRIVDLRNQLQHILESVFPRFLPATHQDTKTQQDTNNNTIIKQQKKITFPVLLEPPTNAEEIALRQILVAGYCDQIAKRSPFATIRAFLERQQQQQTTTSSSDKPVNYLSRRRKFTAYLSGHPSLQTTGPVYLHPTSNLYAHDITQASETLPEYICYTHLMKNQRGDTLYLTNVTVIQPQWLATLALECPLLHIRHSDVQQQLDVATTTTSSSSVGRTAPLPQHLLDDKNYYHRTVKDAVAPYYDCVAEQMMLYVKPRYGVHLWTLPSVSLSMRYVLDHWTEATTANATGDTAVRPSAMPVGYRSEDLEHRWFARCLLLGHVPLPLPVSQLTRVSLTDVQCLQQAAPHPKLLALLRRLVETRVADRRRLLQVLRETPQFLAKEIETLLKKEHQRAFRVQWQRLAMFLETAEGAKYI